MKNLIQKYINNLTINDVVSFANKNNIDLSNDEVDYIYKKNKKNWETLIFGNPTFIFNDLKNHISSNNYNKVLELFNLYRNKYKSYL